MYLILSLIPLSPWNVHKHTNQFTIDRTFSGNLWQIDWFPPHLDLSQTFQLFFFIQFAVNQPKRVIKIYSLIYSSWNSYLGNSQRGLWIKIIFVWSGINLSDLKYYSVFVSLLIVEKWIWNMYKGVLSKCI